MIADTFEFLRPKLKLFTTMEEAIEAVEALNKGYQEQIGERHGEYFLIGSL